MRVYQVVLRTLGFLLLPAWGSTGSPTGSDGLVLIRIVDGSNEVVQVRLRDGAERSITQTPGRRESWPYWSAPAQQLIFQAERVDAGTPRLHLWSPEAGERLLDTRTPAMERWADWAPTRPLLAYSRGKDIFVAEVGEGTAPPRRLVAAGRGETMVRPIWAPDSSRLVVQRSNLRRLSKLWVADLEGATRQLTHDPDWFDSKSRFTRDGERIVYTRRPTAGGPRQLAVVPVKGGTPRPLFGESGTDDHSASISPTRDELVFISDQSGRPQLHRADLAGGGRRQLSDIPGSVWAPHWSADGERIVAIVREGLEAPRLRDQDALARIRVVVYDREGELLYEAPGFMPNWMPAWP